ncbi:hypothetical protein F5X97DRAFT_345142 [Nemania serpens]|nr:hypothetical protein F5X97DRAFT_345142 [Nemania serpens]
MRELAQTVLVAAITLVVLTALATGVRLCDRFCTARVPGWDDATRYGLGIHRADVSHDDYRMFLKLRIIASVSYSLGITSAKASFAVLYIRLFPIRWLAILNKIIVGFLLIRAIEESLIAVFKCRPTRKSWTPDLEGDCLDLHPLWYAAYGLNLATDVMLFLQPILVAWRLQMPVVKRLELGAMFSLGFLVTGMAVIRLKYVIMLGADDTYGLAEALIWSAAEVCSLIICACIPSFRRVALKTPYLNTVFGQSTRRSSETCVARPGAPIPLQRRNRNEYIQSRPPEINNMSPFPSTTQITMTASGLMESGRGDFFPHKADSTGVIVKAREAVEC